MAGCGVSLGEGGSVNRALRWSYHCSRLLLGGLFLYAGLVKAANVAAFAGEVSSYKILPYAWNFLVAAVLPYVEVLAGFLLLLNRKVRPAALVLGLLTAIFIAALASVLARGMNIDCGCFRPGGSHTSPLAALLRDVGLLLLAAICYRLRDRSRA
jgi:putative oxidoreductase